MKGIATYIAAYFAIGFLHAMVGACMSVCSGNKTMGPDSKVVIPACLFLWPVMDVILACILVKVWLEDNGFCPLTWVFAWPAKLFLLLKDRRRSAQEERKDDQ